MLPLAAAFIAFAVANREAVVVSFDPLPFAYSLPLFVVVYAAGFLALLAGGFAAWVHGSGWRRLARQRKREIQRLEDELARRPPNPAARPDGEAGKHISDAA